jgi:Ca2+:H+ antiporter
VYPNKYFRFEPMNTLLLSIRDGKGLLFGIATAGLWFFFGTVWLADLSQPLWAGFCFSWLFLSILWLSFGVVRHADALAIRLGEPYGTIVLTLAVIGIEVAMIAAVSLTGKAHPGLARDTMFSVVMIVLTGMLGGTLLAGGLRHHRQEYNLSGANAYLGVLVPLAVLTLIVPRFTESAPGGNVSSLQAAFLLVTSAGLYVIFLLVQTGSQAAYFLSPTNITQHHDEPPYSTFIHALLLVLSMVPVVFPGKKPRQVGGPWYSHTQCSAGTRRVPCCHPCSIAGRSQRPAGRSQ